MAHYGDLATAKYHLVQLFEHSTLEMIYVVMATEKALLIEYQDDEQTRVWKKKSDDLYELLETLSDDAALEYEALTADAFEEEEDWEDWQTSPESTFWEEDEEDDDDFDDRANAN